MDHFKTVIPLCYILLFSILYKDETCLLYIRTQCALRSKHNSVIQKQQVNVVQGETLKFLDNCYKTQITSYMDMIYFYSSKYIPP